ALYAPLILVPVDIVRNINDDSYILRSRLEETQINITLLEFLKQYFGIEIEGLDPLPLDAHGVDMELIMHRIQAAIQDKRFWEISNDISLGHFSFAKFVMWNDIHNHAADMAQNKVIDSLLHGYRTWKPKDSNITEENIEAVAGKFNMIMPTSADSSQMVSIAQALNGESFVLQGPPGTGKSQTITNLIANALYNGKKVLFVAEKKAALDVVKRRLDGMGLANFCLSMHSDDANKVSLLARLEQTLETMSGKDNREKYQQIVAEVKQLRGKLNGIIDALHCQRKYGCSLYQAIAILKKTVASKTIIKFDREHIINSSKDDLDGWKELVREYKAAMLEMGGCFNTALADYHGTSYSMSLRDSLAQAIEKAWVAVNELEPAWKAICSFIGVAPDQVSYNKIKNYLDALQSIAVPQYVIADIVNNNDSDKLIQDINLFLDQLASYKKDLAGCGQYFDLRVLDLDIQAAKTSWEFATKMGDFDGVHNRLHSQLQSYAKPGVVIKPEVMPFNYNYLKGIIIKRDALLKFGETLRVSLGTLYQGVDTDLTLVKDCVQANLDFAKQYAGIGGSLNLSVEKLSEYAHSQDLIAAVKQVASCHRELEEFAASFTVALDNKKALPNWPEHLKVMLENLSNNIRGLRSQVAYNVIAQKLEQAGLQCIVDAFEAGSINCENVDTAFNGGLYYNLVMGTVAHDERLADFYGMKYNQIIERYKLVVDQYQKACTDELVAKLCQRVAGILNETRYAEAIATLKKAIKGKGRNKPIRKLFSEIQDLLPNIAPCMLMNPISVAQYIDISFPKFDLVIFDEASQIPTSEAVGAIARGIDAIVVGDSKQMPPTNFFANTVSSEEDEDAEDMESLLVDCQTISMPITELKWHYRSQHESLIAFSNLQYYNGHLLTFPTPNDLVSEVRIVHPEGYYDRKSGCNKAEAEAIVAEIIRRYRDPKLRKDSIGVITFNIKQQTYIEDMLEKTIKLPGNEDLIEFNIPKNVFVKNLENVQGDEADVILFSIGYAPDKDGKLTMNFGPLNRDGGWRRLNVAVSRSRKSMIIYAVLKPEQIRNDVTAQGVRNLKEFLAYAENRRTLAAESKMVVGQKADYLVQEIAKAIEEMGYQVQCNIGNSEFKMDIGVVNPYNDAEYLMGILLDSENCKEAATAKDRFVLQPS
ncbi:MAG: AAA domain-containing protein, partial [Phascolarctobacterium sp.]